MRIDVLADDDGVVDHDAQYQDEGEQRDDVHRHVEPGHQRDGAEERNGNAEADPEREPQLQKQGEHQEHQHEPAQPVPEHGREPGLEYRRLVLPDREQDARGQRRSGPLDVFVDAGGDVERALVAGPEDGDQHGGIGVEARELVGLGETVDNGRHLSELETRPVGAREQDETFVFVAAVRLADRAEEDLAALAAHRAARQIERRAAHGVGHVVEGEPVAPERRLRHLDGDLVGPRARYLNERDRGYRGQVVANPVGGCLQRLLVG